MKNFLAVTMFIAFAALVMRASAQVSNNCGKEFSVQILAANGPVKTDDKKFKGVADVKEEILEGAYQYKYTSAHTKSLREASELKKKMVDAGFIGAFVVSYTDGKRDSGGNAICKDAPDANMAVTTKDKNQSSEKEDKEWHPITERESIGYNTIKK